MSETGGAFSTHSKNAELKIDAEPSTDIWNVLPLSANTAVHAAECTVWL
jgi:hypothetical protein